MELLNIVLYTSPYLQRIKMPYQRCSELYSRKLVGLTQTRERLGVGGERNIRCKTRKKRIVSIKSNNTKTITSFKFDTLKTK